MDIDHAQFDIINTHAHVYPQKIAAKACASVAEFYGVALKVEEGTPEHLLKVSERFGIRRSVIHSVATKKEQVRAANTFLAGYAAHPRLWPFATLHPDMDAAELRDEVAAIRAAGLHGIKLHPDCQRFAIAGDDGRRILDAIGDGLPVLVHAGDKRFRYSNPEQIVAVAKDYPHILFVAAHFGAWSEWEKAELYADAKNVIFDTSSSLPFIGAGRALELIRGLGAERFMFATDYPMWDLGEELGRFMEIVLADEERRGILAGNARRWLGISEDSEK